jgi:Domain of unknown function (DUF4337)
MDASEVAREHLEEEHHRGNPNARHVAVLVAVLAAALAVTEMGEKASQNAYLSHHVQAADYWGFFQAKNIRSTVQTAAVEMMEALPNAADPAVRQRIDAARAEAARLRDDPEGGTGSKQIEALARREEAARGVSFHKYHLFEATVGALQLSIVLASVSVITRVGWLAYASGAIGGLAALLALLVAAGLA